MPLAEYLASEQAREDVRVAVNAMATSKTSTFCGGLEDHWIESTHLEAWLRVAYFAFGGKDFLVSAYYRLDGDRYVVTDLGEGVRALRLRTGRDTPTIYHLPPGTLGQGVGFGGDGCVSAAYSIPSADLPDAICRVMLASLRVARS